MPLYVLQFQAGAPTISDLETYLIQNVADTATRQQLLHDGDAFRVALDALTALPAGVKTADLRVTTDPVPAYERDGTIVPVIALVDALGPKSPFSAAAITAFTTTLKTSASPGGGSISSRDALKQIALDLDALRRHHGTVLAQIEALEKIDGRIVAIAKSGTGEVLESTIAYAMAARALMTAGFADLLARVTDAAEQRGPTATFAT